MDVVPRLLAGPLVDICRQAFVTVRAINDVRRKQWIYAFININFTENSIIQLDKQLSTYEINIVTATRFFHVIYLL